MKGTRVVIVDDEVPIRESLRLFNWGSYGYELAGEARHGQEALELCGRVQPGIVVTDIVMPVMDGLRLTNLLKEQQSDVQIILLTCHSEFDYARQALALGACEYLLKGTYREEDLLAALNKARDRIPAQRLEEAEREECAEELNKRYEIRHAESYIMEHLGTQIDLPAVAAHVGLSANYFGLLFRKETGVSFQDYIKRKRLEKAAHLLLHSPMKVYEVAAESGFPNYRHFSDVFCHQYGRSPREYRGGYGHG
ncbi:MAG: hypothetical protein K0R67_1384 [Paenibacillus sp.]|nr:hypothetical protein [Paenibacillus sp.]